MVIPEDKKIADTFSWISELLIVEYYDSIVPKLSLAIAKDVIFAINGFEDSVLEAVHKYQSHPSIFAIKEKYKGLNFSFSRVSLSNLQNELKSLDPSKSVHKVDIHCVKSVQTRSFFWSLFSRIQCEFGKIRNRKNPVYGHLSHSDTY